MKNKIWEIIQAVVWFLGFLAVFLLVWGIMRTLLP